MKKSFPFSSPDHAPARVVEAIKHDVRKYVKRERGKPVPEGSDYWDFACKVGADRDAAETKHLKDINVAIDAVAVTGAAAVYIEIAAVPAKHARHPALASAAQPAPLATGLDGSATHSLHDPA
jgi:hypothetical protein